MVLLYIIGGGILLYLLTSPAKVEPPAAPEVPSWAERDPRWDDIIALPPEACAPCEAEADIPYQWGRGLWQKEEDC